MTTPASLPAARTWSPYQGAIFTCMAHSTGNMVVEAVAGSGKTTTLVEGLRRWQDVNPGKRAIFLAFNRSIADELKTKVPAGVDAATLHSVGFAAVRGAFRGVRVDDRKAADHADHAALAVSATVAQRRAVASDLVRAYDLLKGTMTALDDVDAVSDAITAYGLVLENHAVVIDLLPAFDVAMRKDTARISFTEMLSFVVDHNCAMRPYDLVCVDESQDLNAMQLALLHKLVRPGTGRLCAVGDSSQAIYLFRGADAGAMDRIRSEFNVPAENELPLSITYRCPRKVVEAAQKYVPHIQPSATAIDGEVIEADAKQLTSTLMGLTAGDMIVCRCNAPLVSAVLALIRNGRKATVRGRDIGLGLRKLVKMLERRHDGTVPGLAAALSTYEANEIARFLAANKPVQAQQIEDRCETLAVLMNGLADIAELDGRIEHIFSDEQGGGVVGSSIHKAKGLEANKVVWLEPGLCGFFAAKAMERKNEAAAAQESNLAYVAITRAKHTLIMQPLPRDDDGDE